MSSAPHEHPIFLGIGLVIVGLLAGILVMLFVVDVRAPEVPQVVERVQLGSQDRMRSSAHIDTARAPMMMDMATLNQLFREVASYVTPAVVYIEVETDARRDLPRRFFEFEDEEQEERFFREFPRQSVGSGVIISPDGYVITNEHVIKQANAIHVTLADKRQFEADVVGVDPSTDLAVLRLDGADEFPAVTLGDSDQVEVGEWVLAVGNPFRLTSTVTAGIVSALGRQVNIIDDDFRIEDFIQTDAAINPGNSGGALVNLDGELVGISTAIATESGSYEGYGFAVPVNLMQRVAQDLIEYGEVRRGILGIELEAIGAQRARELGLAQIEGVYIHRVSSGGAADRAGLRSGDVILQVNGREVNAPNELQREIARYHPGERVEIVVWRDGETRQYPVELLGRDDPSYADLFQGRSSQPESEESEGEPERPDEGVTELPDWGIGLRDALETELEGYGAERGVYIAYVEHGGVAYRAGLPRGVILTGINDYEPASTEEAVDLLERLRIEEDVLLLRVQRRDGIAAFYDVPVPELELVP